MVAKEVASVPWILQPMEMSWHQDSGTENSQTRNTPHRLSSIDEGKSDEAYVTYHVFPNVFAPFFSASRRSCAALN